MNIENCTVCGKIFVKAAKSYCPECSQEQEALYHEVRDYLKKKHPKSTLLDIHAGTGIAISKLIELQKEYISLS